MQQYQEPQAYVLYTDLTDVLTLSALNSSDGNFVSWEDREAL